MGLSVMEECRSSPSLGILNKGFLTSKFNIFYKTILILRNYAGWVLIGKMNIEFSFT